MDAIIETIYSSLTVLSHGHSSVYTLAAFTLYDALTERLQFLQGILAKDWLQRNRVRPAPTCPSGCEATTPMVQGQHRCDVANLLCWLSSGAHCFFYKVFPQDNFMLSWVLNCETFFSHVFSICPFLQYANNDKEVKKKKQKNTTHNGSQSWRGLSPQIWKV